MVFTSEDSTVGEPASDEVEFAEAEAQISTNVSIERGVSQKPMLANDTHESDENGGFPFPIVTRP